MLYFYINIIYLGGILNKISKTILNIFFIIICCVSLTKIFFKFYDYKKASSTYESLENIITKNSNNKSIDLYNNLKDLNSDYISWIEIQNTNINYPVMQTSDNKKYITTDFYNNKSKSGSIFLDYRNNFEKDFNNLIYGHNMKNKTMFNNLENFKDVNFFNQHNKINLTIGNSKNTYEVFSVYIIDGNSNSNPHYLINNNTTPENINTYIDKIINKSLHKSNLTVKHTDKILSLITCSYEDIDVRTVIHAKLIKSESLE